MSKSVHRKFENYNHAKNPRDPLSILTFADKRGGFLNHHVKAVHESRDKHGTYERFTTQYTTHKQVQL